MLGRRTNERTRTEHKLGRRTDARYEDTLALSPQHGKPRHVSPGGVSSDWSRRILYSGQRIA